MRTACAGWSAAPQLLPPHSCTLRLRCSLASSGGVWVGPRNPPPNLIWALGGGPTKHQPTAQTCQREKASIRLEAANATVEPYCWDGTASGCVRVAGSGNDALHACTTHHFDDNHHHHHQHYLKAPPQAQPTTNSRAIRVGDGVGGSITAPGVLFWRAPIDRICDRSFPFEPSRILPCGTATRLLEPPFEEQQQQEEELSAPCLRPSAGASRPGMWLSHTL